MICPRLVRFMASAFDTRYAFIASLGAEGGALTVRHLSFWLTRDHGLSVEWREGQLADGLATPEVLDGLSILRRLRPDDGGLSTLEKGTAVTVSLFDPQGALLGQMGVADPGTARRFLARERLQPLARVAEAELTGIARHPSSLRDRDRLTAGGVASVACPGRRPGPWPRSSGRGARADERGRYPDP